MLGKPIDDETVRRILAKHYRPTPGGAICFMFNKIAYGKTSPKYISTDNDPLFGYWLWESNLEYHYQIDEVKTVPYCPWSHPFIERLIGSCRREFTDHILFWSESDLLAKLSVFQEYFNSYRVHYSHDGKTPVEMAGKRHWLHWMSKTLSGNRSAAGCTTHRLRLRLEL